MHRLTALATGVAFAALAVGASSSAQAADDFWTGPYVGLMYGTAHGTAEYTFNTDGYYNTAPGQTFSVPVSGKPIGGTLGYSWQSGNLVYGIDTTFESAILGISHRDTPDPFNADADFDLKGHWFSTVGARIGLSLGRVMVYASAGPALGHLVARVDDTTNDYYIWTPHAVLGLSAAVGAQVAVSKAVSFGVEYRVMTFRPLNVSGESLNLSDDSPAGPATATNHDIRYTNQMLMGRVDFHFGPRETMSPERQAWDAKWTGLYVGAFGGALHQAGGAVGYNVAIGDNWLAGVEAQASVDFCCGVDFEADVNARIGYLLRDKVWLYGEAGVGYLDGSFYGLLSGALYTAGGGIEISLTPRTSAFVELKAVGGFGQGFMDANFQSGFNIHLN